MDDTEETNVETILLASRVPFYHGLYVVGPFAERVSFASQQRRALNLVFAIDQDLKASGESAGLASKDVCVVGAGLAGLTCSVALMGYESQCWIFEKQKKSMLAMRSAGHRDVHPTINFWPRERVRATTVLPYLNWYQDRCDKVITKLEREWEELKRDRFQGLETNCEVTGIRQRKDKIVLSVSRPEIRKREFDIVILTLGFGSEADIARTGSPGYWDGAGDRIGPIADRKVNPATHYVVSGTGDGGIIEVLRLLYTRFRAGNISPPTVHFTRARGLEDPIKKMESAVRKHISDQLIHRTYPLTPKEKDDAASTLWKGYCDLIQNGPIHQDFDLEMGQNRTDVPHVILVGRRSTPTEFMVSPYHKLLLTYAICEGLVTYYQLDDGDIQVSAEPTRQVTLPPDGEQLEINPKRLRFGSRRVIRGGNRKAVILDGPMVHDFKDSLYTCRHGYVSPLHKIFKKKPGVVEEIKKNQALYADQDWLSRQQIRNLSLQISKIRPFDSIEWINKIQSDAKAFFSKAHGLSVKFEEVVGSPEGADKKLEICLQKPAGFVHEEHGRMLEFVPRYFYGTHVRKKVTDVLVQPDGEGH